jgi:hypothetical protein
MAWIHLEKNMVMLDTEKKAEPRRTKAKVWGVLRSVLMVLALIGIIAITFVVAIHTE